MNCYSFCFESQVNFACILGYSYAILCRTLRSEMPNQPIINMKQVDLGVSSVVYVYLLSCKE